MTLYQVIKGLERIALTHPNVRTAENGNIYEILNANPSVEYNAFVVTQNKHKDTDQFSYYGLTLFMVDRLVDDLESNRLQVQSMAKQLLSNIIMTFCNEYDIDVPTIVYQPFTQKFQDLTAGMYAQVEFEIPLDLVCAEEYE